MCKCTVLVNCLAQLEKLTWKLDEGDGVLGTPLFLLSFSFPLLLSFLLLSLDTTFVYVCLFVLVFVCVSLCLSLSLFLFFVCSSLGFSSVFLLSFRVCISFLCFLCVCFYFVFRLSVHPRVLLVYSQSPGLPLLDFMRPENAMRSKLGNSMHYEGEG
jgi:hypothetical protein